MTAPIEDRVRAAGGWPVGDPDIAAIGNRARRRNRRRRTTQLASIVGALIIVIAVAAVVVSGAGNSGHDRIDTTGRPLDVEWSRLATPPGANAITSVVGRGSVVVATGNTIPPDGAELTATIWLSSDGGSSWTRVFDEPSVRNPNVPPDSGPVWLETWMAQAYSVDGMFVVRGGTRTADGSVRGAIWASENGIDWLRADESYFEPTDPVKPGDTSGIRSTVYDIASWNNELLAIGEVFANNSAPSGVTPAVWTSPDGITWERQVVDLGAGYDPYFDSVVVNGDQVIAMGRMGRWPIVQWTSRDLRTWEASYVDKGESGSARVNKVASGFVATGTQTAGNSGRSQDPTKRVGTPSIWWSPNARSWQLVLQLPSRKTPNGNWFFGPAAATRRWAVVTGPAKDITQPSTSPLYGSTGGREWSPLPRPDAAARSLVVAGRNDDAVYVSGAGAIDPTTQRAPLLLWSVRVRD